MLYLSFLVSSLERSFPALHSRIYSATAQCHAGQNSKVSTLICLSPLNPFPVWFIPGEDSDTPISPGGTHFSYDSYKMENCSLKNCIGSVSVTTEMRRSGAKTLSSIYGGKGDAPVSQFSVNSLLRRCFCELENLRKVSPLLCYSRKLPHFLSLLEDTL